MLNFTLAQLYFLAGFFLEFKYYPSDTSQQATVILFYAKTFFSKNIFWSDWLYVGDLDDMYKVSRQAKRYLTIWRNGNSVVNVLRFSVIYFRLMTLFPNDPIVTFVLARNDSANSSSISKKKNSVLWERTPI